MSTSETSIAGPVHERSHDRAVLADEGVKIEHLLDEIQSMAGPQTWPRIEELMSRVVNLYGEALERILMHIGDGGGLDDELWRRLCGDDVVASLLVLHDLHPRSQRERIEAELLRLAPWLERHGARVEIVSVDAGRAHVRLLVDDVARANGLDSAPAAVEKAIKDGAPEITSVVVEAPPLRHEGGLVQITRPKADR